MNTNELADLLDQPETHQKILGGYQGPYALGVTKVPGHGDAYGFVLRLAGDPPDRQLRTVNIGGHQIPLMIQGGFAAPTPY